MKMAAWSLAARKQEQVMDYALKAQSSNSLNRSGVSLPFICMIEGLIQCARARLVRASGVSL
jgi:hypothetical protein